MNINLDIHKIRTNYNKINNLILFPIIYSFKLTNKTISYFSESVRYFLSDPQKIVKNPRYIRQYITYRCGRNSQTENLPENSKPKIRIIKQNCTSFRKTVLSLE